MHDYLKNQENLEKKFQALDRKASQIEKKLLNQDIPDSQSIIENQRES